MPTSSSAADCDHVWEEQWEDDILMGMIFYGHQCSKCWKTKYDPGSLALGVYK